MKGFRDNHAMPDPETIDRYLTQKIVGDPMVVTLGTRAQRHGPDAQGIWIARLSGEAALASASVRTVWADVRGRPLEPELAGQPLSLAGLIRWRRQVWVAGALIWGGVLFAAGWYAHG
jgi:hypothetical protein